MDNTAKPPVESGDNLYQDNSDLPGVIEGMPPPDQALIDSLNKLFYSWYGQGTGLSTPLVFPTNAEGQIFSKSYQPAYWIIRLKAAGCVGPIKLRRDGGRDAGVFLNGPAGAVSGGTLSFPQVTGSIINSGQQGTIVEHATVDYLTGTIGADPVEIDKAEVTSDFVIGELDTTTDPYEVNITYAGGEAPCWGDEIRIVLPGASRLYIEPPTGNSVQIAYSIAAIKGYDPASMF